MNKVKKSKGISVSGICEWGGTFTDSETEYYYQIDFDRNFAGIFDTVLAYAVHGDDAASRNYDEKVGANTADDVYHLGTTGFVTDNPEYLKGQWTMTKYGGEWIYLIWIPYGHHVCKNNDGDGLTEVCSRQIAYHKVDKDEHAIDVDNFSWCLKFKEE